MYRIAIVEDEEEYTLQLKTCLRNYEKLKEETFQISCFNDGIEILDGYSADYDMIFLDIKMKHVDGMETAQKIRRIDSDVIIIFITSLAQYAIAGYKVNAMDFILKPVKENQLNVTLDNALASIRKWKREKMLKVTSGSDVRKISTDDIYYVEVSNHDLTLYLKNETVMTRNYTLSQLEKELAAYSFVRANQYQLVNLKYIIEIKKDEVVLPCNSLFLSRNRKKDFIMSFAEYIGAGS